MRRCAEHPLQSEFSLCGDAFDIQAVDQGAEDFKLAGPNESINCPNCCTAIREIKAIRNRLRPRTESTLTESGSGWAGLGTSVSTKAVGVRLWYSEDA